MVEWCDEGIVLAVRRLGETSIVLSLLTRAHGRHSGLVRGGASWRNRGMLQPGNRLATRWRARLADHLGTMSCEPGQVVAAQALGDRLRLAGIAAACAVAETALPEREPLPQIYNSLADVIAAIETDTIWPACYVRWEVALLAELGFGLDLGRCALTGATDGLAYVSPRSGRAVSGAAAGPWHDRLLPLPAFLLNHSASVDAQAVAAGLALTGHFLLRHVYADQRRTLPAARARLPEQLARTDLGRPDSQG